MILTISNLDDVELAAVVEPSAEERSVLPRGKVRIRVDIEKSSDFELVVGNNILSIYIPDEAEYAFIEE